VPLLLVPAALLMLESLAGPPLYIDRYVLYGEAGAALLAGDGLYRIGQWLAAGFGSRPAARRRTLVWVPAAVVLACALLLQLTPLQRVRGPGSRLFNFGGPAQYVAAHARTGDGVLFFDAFFRKIRLGYPGDFTRTSDFSLAVPPVAANPFRGINKPFSVIRPLMLARERIWVIGRRPSASLPAGPVREESAVLLRYFTRVEARGWRGVWVTLWVRR
jgi:mannosyltransferase